MGNTGSASSKRRSSESEEATNTSVTEHRPPSDFGHPLQPPRKKALLTTPEVPDALQKLIDDVNMDTMAMKLRDTSISANPAGIGGPPSDRPMCSSLPASAFRNRFLTQKDELECTLNAQGVAMAYIGSENKLPTVFKWDGGGKEVYVSGSFNEWSAKIQMVKSTHNFYTIVDLPAGRHEYKFIVDGQWKSDPHQTVVENQLGSYNNVITVKPTDFQVFQALAEDVRQAEEENRYKSRRRTVSHSSETVRSGSPEGHYTQHIPSKNDFLWEIGSRDAPTPPLLPPQMLHVILNDDTSPHYDPNLLPEPNHVMLNHMYALSIKDGVMVLSLILRYRKKFVTTVLYKPIDAAGIPKGEGPPPDLQQQQDPTQQQRQQHNTSREGSSSTSYTSSGSTSLSGNSEAAR